MDAAVVVRKFLPWTGALLVIAYLLVLFVVDPSQGGLPACPFRALSGWSCPGCGSQRAIHELLHLQIAEAFRQNALLIIAPILLLAQWCYSRWVNGARGPWMPNVLLFAWVVVVIAWGIVRNGQGW